MRLLILDQNYPHLGNLMGDVFVHVRAKEYSRFHDIQVFSYFQEPSVIEYEGMSLRRFDDVDLLSESVINYNADKILIHFYQSWMLEKIILKTKAQVIIWVHLFEAVGWYRRLFNYNLLSPVFFRYVLKNTCQQFSFRKLTRYAKKSDRIQFVFVSNWMKRTAEKDTLTRIPKFDVIPNPIDINLFIYSPKQPEHRTKILLLRSFDSKKYANDISVKAILLLSKKAFFKELSFTIIGDGNLFDRTLKPIVGFKNVHIERGAVRQILIPAVHQTHGIFLCPTRQDSHGVSMCEAMASGLVPISSDNSAIPEYVENNVSGILTNSPQEIAAAIEKLYYDPEQFLTLSGNASAYIKSRCDIKEISNRELAIIES